MIATRYLLKLYEMPPEYGHISAFDTYANTIFVGTDKGVLMRFTVEGARAPDAARRNSTSAEDVTDKRSTGEDGTACGNRGEMPGKHVKCEEAHEDNSLVMSQLEKICTTLVQHISISKTGRRVERIQHSRTHKVLFVLCERRLLAMNSATFEHILTISEYVGTFFAADSRQRGTQRAGRHVICATEPNGRELRVFDFDISRSKRACATLSHEMMLPEQAHVLAMYGSMVCVGMRRGYCLLSLPDGNTCNVLPLAGDMHPLLAAGDGEVFMRYDRSIFSVSMLSMPSGRVLGRTIQLEDEPRHMIVRHPFLFAFTKGYCDVYSLYDDDVSERLPMAGCLFGSQLGRGDFLYAASPTKIWMAGLHSLRYQLADLVERFKVEEAFQLLSAQRSRTNVNWQGIELELHIMVGFAYLHRCRPKEAMLHFNDHIDPRDLLLLLPECIPPNPEEYSAELCGLLRGNRGEAATSPSKDTSMQGAETEMLGGGVSADATVPASDSTAGLGGSGFWAEWNGCCPYNTYVGELEKAWLETFDTFPLLPHSVSQSDEVVHRQVMEWGYISSEVFLKLSWEVFKDELIVYFRSRLEQASPVYARAMEYALLVLVLETRDHCAAYQIVTNSSYLCVEDCYDLLLELHEYRLLACLLHRRGYTHEADRVLKTRVYVSSLLPRYLLQRRDNNELSPAYTNIPTSLHARVQQLLCPQAKNALSGMLVPRDSEDVGALNNGGARSPTPQPSSLSLAMYLVSHLNVPALQKLLVEDPGAAATVDEEGCTMLHVLFSLLMVAGNLGYDELLERGGAMLGLVLSCALLLLDHGADPSLLEVHGLSCLDVLAVAADGVFLDATVAALLADREVRKARSSNNRGNDALTDDLSIAI
uniref:CNH domain-containing protein n=1 Tax=Trypanosoma congolense (strain IL3000) TaxID=1068625 RepID=G0UYP5_TRYCI|nr:conserved hypothetical protein [Trypanosoma congolense IL3000]